MRPEILFPLFAPTTSLKGVGPRIAKMLERVAGTHIIDLDWLLPVGIIDRRYAPTIADAPDGAMVTITVIVGKHQKSHNRRSPYRVECFDDTGAVTLVFFSAHDDYLKRLLPEGEERVVSGRMEIYQDSKQITHPDHVVPVAEKASIQVVEPVYPLTTGLSLKVETRAIRAAVTGAPELPEWLDQQLVTQNKWPAWRDALWAAHSPESIADLELTTPDRTRLAYDELLANQLALGLVRSRLRRGKGRVIKGDNSLRDKLIEQLPYRLTNAQVEACSEIEADMGSPLRMLRLLQGDVGSGKTVVAFMAMLGAVEEGAQAVLLAPTEILARQHFDTIAPFADALGIDIRLLTGRDKGKARQAALADLADGSTSILIGTHAVFQEDVVYHDLALAVIDEQHRFGVHQRLMLGAKGTGAVDVLVMTATPIPRTLTLTAYGDMDISRLMEKPPGRKPINTVAMPLTRLAEVVEGIDRALTEGAQIYWVCPLVEESDELPVTAVEDRFNALKARFGDQVGLVHGRLKAREKDATMEAFTAGEVKILVATTVIEVGVDVPSATVMVIENAERFGLTQIHQLRGRVGRGDKASSCLLLYKQPLTETAKARLQIIRETEDGFLIAEEDLRLRGAGELLGTRQSGLPEFNLADLEAHRDLLPLAYSDARLILETDPALSGPRGEALRILLYLFERDDAIKYLASG